MLARAMEQPLNLRSPDRPSFAGINGHVQQVIGSFLNAGEVARIQPVARAARFYELGVRVARVHKHHSCQQLERLPALRHVTAHVVLDKAGVWRDKLAALGRLVRLETLALHIYLDDKQKWYALRTTELHAYITTTIPLLDLFSASSAMLTAMPYIHTCTINLEPVRDTLCNSYLFVSSKLCIWMALQRMVVAWVCRMPSLKHVTLIHFDHHLVWEDGGEALDESDSSAPNREQVISTNALWNFLAPRCRTIVLTHKRFAKDQDAAFPTRIWPHLTKWIARGHANSVGVPL
jgi:hypothetical protein